MISYLRIQKELRAADREIVRLEAAFAPFFTKAREEGNVVEVQSLNSELRHELSQWWDEKNRLLSRYWLARAVRHDLPVPSWTDEDMWDDSKWFDGRFLTDRGRAIIVNAWWDRLPKYATVLGGICGVAALFVSIIALLK